jgi:hypothetical protein
MAGQAYTPGGFEPDAHERFFAPPKELITHWQGIHREIIKNTKPIPYDTVQEYRQRGESHLLGHYAFEMMFDIYAGIEDELMDGAIDCHLHIFPDYVPRSIDIIQLAINASKAKMRAVVCKDHFFTNVGMAWAAQWVVEEMVRKGELEKACKVFGTHILAWSHNPEQVKLVRKYPNLGALFFYTMTGGQPAGFKLPILDSNGKLMTEVKECIQVAAENNICVMTGHKTPDLVMPMVEYAHEVGAHILITHSGGNTAGGDMAGTIEQAKRCAELGAYLEVNGNKFLPNLMWPMVDPNVTMDYIRAVGPEHCVADTDFGQLMVFDPIDGMRLFIRGMLHFGFSKEEVKMMVQTNPAKLLYLDK